MSNNIKAPVPVYFPSSPRYIPRSPSLSYHTCPTHPWMPPPWVIYHIPFPAMPCQPTSKPSHVLLYGSPSTSPAHISLTVNEIELYTLESWVQHNMADCLQEDPLTVELWECLQFEMRAARDLEALVWEYWWLIGAQWERFRTWRYDWMFKAITQQERRRWEKVEEVPRRSQSGSPIPLVVRNPTPLPLHAPVKCPPTPIPGSSAHPIEIHDGSSEYGPMEEFEWLARAHEESPMGQREWWEHQQQIEHDEFIEWWAAQDERLTQERMNAHFGGLGVRRCVPYVTRLYLVLVGHCCAWQIWVLFGFIHF